MKQKTHKGASKRVRITKKGKILKKRVNTSHLNRKNTVSTSHRKDRLSQIIKGYKGKIKSLLNI